MRIEKPDPNKPKGWYAGPWDSALPISIGYANKGVDDPRLHKTMTEVYCIARGTVEVRIESQTVTACSVGESYQNEFANDRFHGAWNAEDSTAGLRAYRPDPTLWQIAWAGDEVAGQVISLIAKGRPEMYDVSVRRAWRRKGLARAPINRALRGLYERGYTVVRLHTTLEFPTHAMDLYRSLGFRVVRKFPRYRKSPR